MTLDYISMTSLDEAFYEAHDVGEVIGDPGFDDGRQHPQGRHVFMIDSGVFFRDHRDRNACRFGRGVDLVIDIGDIADIDHLGETLA
jgi:hypothetical protein